MKMVHSKMEVIEISLPKEYKAVIERAAQVLNLTLADFMIASSCGVARSTLIDEATSASTKRRKSKSKSKSPVATDGQIMQFKVSLRDIRPPIWRRIQVPASYTFYDLHVAIQDIFNWEDYHLHVFRPQNPKTGEVVCIGIPDDDPYPGDVEHLPGWEIQLSDYFQQPKDVVEYEYDFGDSWYHLIELEKIMPREAKVKYPRCIDGKRNGPPEDCGGICGYQNFLEAIASKKHPDHEQMVEWIGGSFDPEAFNPAKVKFEDPRKRFKRAFQ